MIRLETSTVVAGSDSARAGAVFLAEGPLAQNINGAIHSQNQTGQQDGQGHD
jgi:hypothetical protein